MSYRNQHSGRKGFHFEFEKSSDKLKFGLHVSTLIILVLISLLMTWLRG